MANFMGTVKAKGRKEKLCVGKEITARIDGWNDGLEIRAFINEHGETIFDIYATNGSLGGPEDITKHSRIIFPKR